MTFGNRQGCRYNLHALGHCEKVKTIVAVRNSDFLCSHPIAFALPIAFDVAPMMMSQWG